MKSSQIKNINKKLLLYLIDSIIILLSVSVSYSLRTEELYFFWDIDIYVNLIFIAVFFSIFYFFNFYRILIRFFDYFAVLKIIKIIFFAQVILIVINLNLYNYFFFPRSISFIAPLIILILIVISRITANYLIKETKVIKDKNNILIYGINENTVSLLKSIRQFPNYGTVKGFIDHNNKMKKREINGIKIYKYEKLKSIIDKNKISELIIDNYVVSKKKINNIFINLAKYNIRIRKLNVANNYLQNLFNKVLQPEINFFDIINRPKINVQKTILDKKIKNKNILITGGGGSIGSHLCLEILKHSPKKLYILDNSEYNLFNIKNQILSLKNIDKNSTRFVLGDFGDINFLRVNFKRAKIDEVYHAAAYKHLQFGEENNYSIIKNNIFGTESLLNYVKEKKIKKFTFISSDKAVNPSSMLGYTKKYGEMLVKFSLNNNRKLTTNFTIVRFGNVIGSSGSVIPIFLRQISQKKTLTVTHKNVERYFMSISEAVQLVINSSYLNDGGFKIFALDMGKQIKIYEIAKRIIRLSGYSLKNLHNKSGDIAIKIIGLKKGEKISEELSLGKNLKPTKNPKILICEDELNIKNFQKNLNYLRKKFDSKVVDYKMIRKIISI